MSDDVERELETMLRERAGAVSQTVEPPADLDAQVLRRRVMARRRKAVLGGLALAAVLVGTVVTVAALSNAPTKKRVDIVNTPTTIGGGADPLPNGTLLVAVDENAHVVALDAHGKPLRTLLELPTQSPVAEEHRGQVLLTPDHRTLWAVSPAAASDVPCTEIVEHDLVTGAVGRRLEGSEFALSPDGTLLAYSECVRDVLHVRDLRSDAEWTTTSPTDLRTVSFLAVSPDKRHVLLQFYLGGDVKAYEVRLTDTPGPVAWGKGLEKVAGEALLTAVSNDVYGVPLADLNSSAGPSRIDVLDWSFTTTHSINLPERLVPGEVVPAGDKVFVLARPYPQLTLGGLFDLAGGGQRLRTDIVSVFPAEKATTTPGGAPVTTVPEPAIPAGGPVPDNAAFISLDPKTGAVLALDENGKALRKLFTSPLKRYSRETVVHPIIGGLRLSPDRKTLWYSVNEAETCPVIVERNLTTGQTQQRGTGDAFALSPDFTRLAYSECNVDQSVHVRELATNREWTATLPGKHDAYTSPINEVQFAGADNRVIVLVRGQQATTIDELLLPDNPGPFSWGRTVINERNLRWFSSTPERLFLSVTDQSSASPKEMIDTYDWSFRRLTRREVSIVVETVSVVDGNEYVVGDSSVAHAPALFRLDADGRTTRLRENVDDLTAVTP